MLNLGNGLVKVGAVEAAKVSFKNAQLMTNYSSWPYRGTLESMLALDLSARAALYSDGTPGTIRRSPFRDAHASIAMPRCRNPSSKPIVQLKGAPDAGN